MSLHLISNNDYKQWFAVIKATIRQCQICSTATMIKLSHRLWDNQKLNLRPKPFFKFLGGTTAKSSANVKLK